MGYVFCLILIIIFPFVVEEVKRFEIWDMEI